MTKTEIKPGYKKTKLGWIPEEWEILNLEDFGSFSKGKGISKNEVTSKGIPCIRYGELYTIHEFYIKEFFSFINIQSAQNSKRIFRGDILFAGSGETLEDIGKCVAFLGEEEAYAGGDIVIFREHNQNAKFLGFQLNSNSVKRQTHKFGQGHSVVHIYSSSLKKLKIPLPPLPEQQKIAAILSTWDEAINNVQRTIEQLELRKKGLMQQLLTGKTRLAGFIGVWEEKQLGEFITHTPRPIPKPTQPYLALGLRSHGKGVFHKPNFDPESISMDTLYVVEKNDLIVNITFAWEHAIAVAEDEDIGGLVSHRFPTYTFKRELSNSRFFKYYFLLPRFKYLLGVISPGGAGRNRVMSKRGFLKLIVKVPTLEEQKKIGALLCKSDLEITQTQTYLATLQQQKKGLMQQLLTGQKRVQID